MNPIFSSGLLAASMFLGQPAEVQTKPSPTPSRPILGWFNRDERPIINRIQTWWKKDSTDAQPTRNVPVRENPPPIIVPTPNPIPNDFPRKLPNPSTKAKTNSEAIAMESTTKSDVKQTTVQQTAIVKGKTPLLAQFTDKVGRDEKFEWVTGQFEIEQGNFVVYYATPETIDKYNGRIVLIPEKVDMAQFRKGDLISVRGQITQRQTLQGVVPIYRTTQASLIERPKS